MVNRHFSCESAARKGLIKIENESVKEYGYKKGSFFENLVNKRFLGIKYLFIYEVIFKQVHDISYKTVFHLRPDEKKIMKNK